MNWRDYEEEIFNIFRKEYPNADVILNTKKRGLYSKIDRQIDILIEDYIAGNRMTIIVDGKFFNKKIDVKNVESFIGMLEDVGAHKGLLISQKGFSKSAINRAYYGPSKVELDVLNFSDLQQFQGFLAFPYSGNNCVILPAPFGWVIDAQRTTMGVATLYERGMILESAFKNSQIMYIQFWDRKKNNDSLNDLLGLQEKNIKEVDANAHISYLLTIKRNDAKITLRKAIVKNYPTPEYGGFIEFDDFIFFCILFTKDEVAEKNIKKLENILMKVMPIKVIHGDA